MSRQNPFMATLALLIVVGVAFLHCTEPLNPMKMDENSRISIHSEQTVLISQEVVFEFSLYLPELIDSIIVDFGDGKHDTIRTSGSDSLYYSRHVFLEDGQVVVTATAYTATVSKQQTRRISVVVPAHFHPDRSVTASGAPRQEAPLSLSVAARGTAPLSYSWYKDDTKIPQSDNATFVIQSLRQTDTGRYYCIVSNEYGQDSSHVYTVELGGQQPPILLDEGMVSSEGEMWIDSALILYISSVGTPAPAFQWFKDDSALDDQTSDTLIFESLQLSDTGDYYCVATNNFGQTVSDTFTLSPARHTFFITVKRGANGTVSPDPQNDTIFVTQGNDLECEFTPDEGYRVSEVLIDGESDGASKVDRRYTFSAISRNHSVEVTFEKQRYAVNVSKTGNGEVAVAPVVEDSVAHGTELTLEATAGQGYYFSGWNGETSEAHNPLVVTVTDHFVITAKFVEIGRYAVNVAINENEGTYTIDPPADDYEEGTEVVLVAVAEPGYRCAGWSGYVNNSSCACTLTVTDSVALSANFSLIEYSVEAQIDTGIGSIDISPRKQAYTYGEQVSLKATPATGYTFQSWSGDTATTRDSILITVTRDHVLRAAFLRSSYTIVVEAGDEITVSPSANEQVSHGDTIDFTFEADSGYRIDSIWVDGKNSLDARDGHKKFAAVDKDHTLRVFTSIKTYALQTKIVPNDITDTIIKNPASQVYTYGDSVTLTAPNLVDYKFVEWSGGASGTEATTSVLMDGNKSVTATYEIKKDTLQVSVTPSVGGTVSPGSGVFDRNTTIILEAAAHDGYRFERWSGDVEGVVSEKAITFNSNKNVVANFEPAIPNIADHPSDVAIYAGEQTELSVTVIGVDVSYQWQKDSVDIELENSSTLVVSESGNYRCVVRNTAGNTVSSTAAITVKNVVTDIDGNEYPFVKIGDQLWTTVNLRVTHYSDGSEIVRMDDSVGWRNDTVGAYCYYTTGIVFEDEKVGYGAYYNWYAVEKGIAPQGWRIPDTTDWNELSAYLTDNGYGYGGSAGNDHIAASLAGSSCMMSSWQASYNEGSPGFEPTANNGSGFSACPSGDRSYTGRQVYMGGTDAYVRFWTVTEENDSNAYFREIHYTGVFLLGDFYPKNAGHSIRLVRDVQR